MVKCDGDMDRWGFFSMKLATAAFVLVVLKLFVGAMNWVHATNVWWFVLAFVVFAIRGGMSCSSKGGCNICEEPIKKRVVRRKVAKKIVRKKR